MKSDIPICSVCKTRTEYDKDKDEYACPHCGLVYDPNREILEYEDEFVTSHSGEEVEIHGISAGVGLLAADDEQDANLTDMLYKSAKHKPSSGYAESWD